MAKSFSKKNVAGIIFTKPQKGDYFGVESWLDAGAPDNCLIYDDPLNLLVVGLTICDAQKVDGIYYRGKVEIPASSKISTRRLTVRNISKSSALEMVSFPGMIFYDGAEKKHAAKKIGTTIQVW